MDRDRNKKQGSDRERDMDRDSNGGSDRVRAANGTKTET